MSILKELLKEVEISSMMSPNQYLRYSPASAENEEEDEYGENEEGMFDEEEELLHNGLVAFFSEHDSPTEEDVRAFADDQGIDPNEVIVRAFTLLHNLIKGVGKHNDVPDDEFDPEQLQKGIEVEQEHTNDALVAKMIAKDHLSELPDYYSRLTDMEDEARSEEGIEDNEGDEDYNDGEREDEDENEVVFNMGTLGN